MPVIGRLDDQVDAVLITRLERGRDRQRPDAPAGEAPAPTHTEPPDEPTAGETSPAPAELPVWLLRDGASCNRLPHFTSHPAP